MAKISQSQQQSAKQVQSQRQKLSQNQIRALRYLEMGSQDLRDEIYKIAEENPAIEIVNDPLELRSKSSHSEKRTSSVDGEKLQQILENTEDRTETLQSHLMHQLNLMKLPPDEVEVSKKLIYNLDKNGFYGSSISPVTLLDRGRPLQNAAMLTRCMERIQAMDPIGTCCKNWEESLFVQAKLSDDATPLTLFILDGHMDLLEPPEPAKVYDKLINYQQDWHKKSFATEIILDKIKYSEEDVEDSIHFILHLNPLPAQGYSSDSGADYEKPDVILEINRVEGPVATDDFSRGIITGDSKCHFQIKYASGVLPELKLSDAFAFDKENYQKAQDIISNLAFRESSIVLQGCAIVSAQKNFFLKGPGELKGLTRREVAKMIGVHESTVSRMAARKGSKYIQTEWGLYPASYFFSSGVEQEDSDIKVSSEVIKLQIQKILDEHKNSAISDSKLATLLNERGIKIARRTVAKYRSQLGISNSYGR